MAVQLCMLAALVAGAFAGPISYTSTQQTCALSCPATPDPRYLAGHTYSYDYTSTVTTSIPGTTEDESRLTLSARAQIQVLAPCDMQLSLSSVSLSDHDLSTGEDSPVSGSTQFASALEQKPLRFAMSNGRVDELCTDDTDAAWIVNIKRAVLSALQTTVPTSIDEPITVTETDVVGECEVTYAPAGSSWTTTTISKKKDLLACTSRQNAETIFQTIPYQVPSYIQSLPLLRSTHECENKFDSSERLTEVSCSEIHTFRPFAKDNSGATTQVSMSLTYTGEAESVSVSPAAYTSRSSLLFEHVPTEEDMDVRRRDVVQTLRTMCSETEEGVRPETPARFAALVKLMRQLDAETLLQVSNIASNRLCDKAQKFFGDAIPSLGTTASVSVMRNLIQSGAVSGSQADLWMSSLTFINKPTKEMLAEVKPLLSVENPSKPAVLSISSLVHSYCKVNPECSSEAEVSGIVSVLDRMLAGDCSGDHEMTMLALKAIGNTGVAQGVVPSLNRCIMNAQISMETRITAINAFRRMPCNTNKSGLESVMTNSRLDSELRINAYLMVMQCPSHDILSSVYTMLESEQVNQVGSFVWTHLTNLMEASSPLKQDIKNILDDSKLQKTFDMDKRKFSRNVEWSAFSEMLNSGATVDSNLIWSSKSFMPRSASVNLTVDLFGQSINLMEVGGRVEGLDSVLESFFGPEENNGRNRRAAVINPSHIEDLDNKFREEMPETRGSSYMRVFGHEISYDDFRGLDLDTAKEKFNYLQWIIDLASEHNYEFTKSMVLLDTEICVPTIMGLPLKLAVDGTTVVDLKLSGKVDLRHLMSSPSNLDIVGVIRPSAALQVEASMGVDAWVTSTGLKMTNTFHTSTLADGSIQLKDGKIFNMDINMPNEQMEIFKAESKFYITHRDIEREQNMLTEGKVELSHCFGGNMQNALGLELCGEVSFPKMTATGAPWFPFTGPASSSLVLYKRDTFNKYSLSGQMMKKQISEGLFNYLASASFNTPGSAIDRELSFNFDLNQADHSASFNMRSPWKKMDISGAFTQTPELHRIAGSAIFDEVNEYSASAELAMTPQQYNTRYETLVTVKRPEVDPYTFTGVVLYRPGRRLETDLALKNVFSAPVTLTGQMELKQNGAQDVYEGDLSVRAPGFKGQLVGSVDTSRENSELITSSSMQLKYKMGNGVQQEFGISSRFHLQPEGERQQISLNAATSTTMWPQYDTDMTISLTKEQQALGASVQVGLTNDKPKRIDLTARIAHDLATASKRLGATASFSFPYKNMAYDLVVRHQHNLNELLSSVQLTFDEGQSATAELELKRETAGLMLMSARAGLTYPGRQMTYTHSLRQSTENTYHHDFAINMDQEDLIKFVSSYIRDTTHQVNAELTNPFSLEPIVFEGRVKPVLNTFDANVRLATGSLEYIVASNWRYAKTRNSLDTSAAIEVSYPERKVKVETTIRKVGTVVSTSLITHWDMERDMTKKMTKSLQLEMSLPNPSFTLRSEWPGKFAELRGNAMVVNKKEGTLHFTSSYPGYESMSTTFTHELTSTAMKSTWQIGCDNQKMDVSLNLNKVNGWQSTRGDLTINTPFSALTHMKVESSQTLQAKSLSTESKINWNQQEMVIELNGNADLAAHTLDGEVKFTSPFSGMEFIVLKGKHSDDGRQYTTSTEATIGIGNTYSTDFSMTHEREGWAITNSGEISINKPVRSKLSWSHSNTDRDWKTHAEIDIDSEKSEFDVSARLRKRSTISASLSTPYAPDMSMELFHMSDKRSWKNIRSTAEFNYDSNTIKAENEFSFEHGKMFTLNTKFVSPVNEQIELNMNNNLEGATFNVHNELTWSTNQKTALIGSVTMNLPSIEGSLSMESPNMEMISIQGMFREFEGTWEVSSTTMYGQYKVYQTLVQLAMGNIKKFHMDLASQHPSIQQFVFEIEHSGTRRAFNTKAELQHFLIGGPLKAELSMDTTNMASMEINFDMQSVIQGVEFVRASARSTGEPGACQIQMNFEMPQQRMMAMSTHSGSSLLDFNHNTEIEYQTGKKIELNMAVSTSPEREVVAIFKSPFTEDKKLMLTCAGRLASEFTAITEITLTPEQKIVANVEFGLNDGIHGTSKITTPFEKFSLLEISFNHRGNLVAFNNGVIAKFNTHQIAGESEFSMTEHINGRVGVKSTFDLIKDAEVSFSHEGSLLKFENEIAAVYNREHFSGSSQFEKVGTTMNGRVTIESIVARFQHSGEATNFQNSASINVYGTELSTTNSFSLTGTDMRLTAKMNVPELYSLTLSHSGPLSAFTNSLTLQAVEKTISLGSEFENGDNLKAVVTAQTPFEGYRNMALQYTHTGAMTDFTCNLVGNMEESRVSGQAKLRISGNTFEHSVTMNTPFNKATQFGYSISQTGALDNMNAEFRANLEESIVSSSATLKLISARKQASFGITTPFEQLQSLNIEATHNGALTNFNNNLIASYNEVDVSAESAFKLLDNMVEAQMKVMVPDNSIVVDVKHTGGMMTYTNELLMSWNEQQITAESRVTSTDNSIDASLSIDTPFSICDTLQASIRNSGSMSNFNNQYTVQLNGQSANGNSMFVYNGNSIEGSLNVNTPYEMFESIKASLKHSGSISNFNNELSAELNGHAISGSSEYSNNGDIVRAAVTLNTPSTAFESFKASGRHSGSITNFNNEFTVELNGQAMTGNSAFLYNGNSLESSMNLNTPYEICQSLKASAKHSGTKTNFNNEFMIDLNGQSISSDAAFMYNGNSLQASSNVETPFEVCRSLKASAKHNGQLSNFNNEFTIELNGQSINGDSVFSYSSNTLEGALNLNTPFETVQSLKATVKHMGQMDNFNNDFKIEWNDQAINGNSGYSKNGNVVRASVACSTTFTMCESLEAEITHTGSITNFNNEISIQLNGQRLSGESAFAVNGNNFDGSLSLTAPFEMCQSLRATARHSGPLTNFNNEIMVELNGVSIKGNAEYSIDGDNIQTSVVIDTPFAICESVKFSAMHSGSLANFNNEFSFEIDGQEMNGDSKLMFRDNVIEGSLNLNTPFEMFRSFKTSAKHSGSSINFNNEFSFEVNGNAMNGNSAFMYSGNGIEGSLALNTPYEMCQSLKASAKFLGSMTNFQNKFNIELNGQVMTGNTAFRLSDNFLEGSLVLNTPFESCQSLKASAKYSGSMTNFQNEFSVELNGQVMNGNTAFRFSDNSLEGSLVLNTPFESCQSLKASAKHSGSMTNSQNEFSVELNGHVMNGNTAFRLNDNSLEGSLVLNTPFESCQSLKASAKHSGSMTNFQNEFSVELNGQVMNGNNAFMLSDNTLEGSFQLNTPFEICQSLTASAKHSGSIRNFNNEFMIGLNGQEINFNSDFSYNGDAIQGSMDVSSPFRVFESLKTSAKLTGIQTNFTTVNTEFLFDLNGNTFTSNNGYSFSSNNVKASVDITTPFEAINTLKGSVSHAGPWYNFESGVETELNGMVAATNCEFKLTKRKLDMSWTANIPSHTASFRLKHSGIRLNSLESEVQATYNDQTITATSQFGMSGSEMKASLSVITPVQAFNNFMVSLEHNGQPSNFNNIFSTSLNGKSINSNAVFRLTGMNVEGSFVLSTPFDELNRLSIDLNQRGNLQEFTHSFSMALNDQTISSNVEFEMSNNAIEASARFATPFAAMESVTLSINHRGPLSNMNNEMSASYNGQTLRISSQFAHNAGNMDWSMRISGPVSVSVNVKHTGRLTNFRNEFSASLSDNTISSIVAFRLSGNNVEGQVTLNSPVGRFLIDAKHEGHLSNFNNEMVVSFNEVRINTNSGFKLTGTSLEGNVAFTSPLITLSASANHEGHCSDFTNQFQVTLNEHTLTSNNHFRLRANELDAAFTVTTAFGQINLSGKHNGAWNNFNNEFSASLNDISVSCTSLFRLDGSNMDGSLRFTSPLGQLSLVSNHAGSFRDFTNELTLTVNDETIRNTVEFRLQGNDMEASLQFVCALIDLKMTCKHNGPITDFKNEITLIVNDQTMATELDFEYTEDKVEFTAALTSPFGEFNIQSKHFGDLMNFNNDMVAAVNGRSVRSGMTVHMNGNEYETSSTFTTPFGRLSLEAKHSGSVVNFNNEFTVSLDDQSVHSESEFMLLGDAMKSSLKLTTPLGNFEGEARHNGPINDFRNKMTLALNDQHFDSHVEFSIDGTKIDSLVRLTSPLGSSSLSINHDGPIHSFTNTISASLNDKQLSSNIEFSISGNTVSTTAIIAGPVYLEFSGKHAGVITDFRNEMSITVAGHKTISDIAFKLEGNTVETSIAFETPFTNIQFSGKHVGTITDFQNELRMTVNGETTTYNGQFRLNGNDLQTELAVTGPLAHLSGSIRHTGTITNFRNEITATYNGQRTTSVATFLLNGANMESSLALTTPSHSINWSAKHNGQLMNFNNEFTLNIDSQIMKSVNEFRVAGNGVDASTRIQTPFSGYRTIEMMATHAGMFPNMETEIKASVEDAEIVGQTMVKKDGSHLEMSGTLETPSGTYAAAYSKDGSVVEFAQELSMTINRQVASIKASFKKNPQIEANLEIATPFSLLNHGKISLTHSGTLKNFNNDALLKINSEIYTSHVEFNKEGNTLHLKAGVNVPQEYSITYDHSGSLLNFNCDALLKINSETYTSHVEFSKSNTVHFKAGVNVPQEYSITLDHSGAMMNFNSDALLKINSESYTGHIEFNKGNTLHLKAGVNVPQEYSITLDHSGAMMNFNSDALLKINSESYTGHVEFSKEGNTLHLKAGVNMPQEYSITFDHSGAMMDFNSDAVLKINSDNYSSHVEFRKEARTLHFMAGVNVPQEYSITLDHSGPWTQFINSLSVKAAEKTLSHNTRFSYLGGRVEASLDATTPIEHHDRVSLTYTHEGHPTNFKQQAQFTYGEKTIRHNIEFVTDGRRFNGLFELATPFTHINTLSLNVAHRGGRWNNYVNSASIELNGMTRSAESKIKVFDKKVIAEFIVKLPQEYSLVMTRKGSLDNFATVITATLDEEVITSYVAYKKTNGIYEGTFNLHTPYEAFRDLGLEFSHTNKQSWKTTGSLVTPFEILPKFGFELNHEGNLQQFTSSAKFETPFTAVPTIDFHATHQGELSNFANSVSLEFAGKRYAASSLFVNDNSKVESSASLQTPHQELTDMSYSFTYTKRPQTSFVAEAVINGEKVEADLSITTDPHFQVVGNLKTPPRRMNLNINQQGRLTDFTSMASFEIDGSRTALSFTFKKTGAMIETSGSLDTPVQGYEQLTFNINYNGRVNDFTTTGTFEVDGRRTSLTLSFKKTVAAIESSGSLVTPYSGYEQVNFSLNHSGTQTDLHTVVSITAPAGTFAVDFEHAGTLANFRSTAQIDTPYTSTISAVITHQGQMNDFRCSANVQYAGERIEGEMSFKNANNNMEGALTINTPFSVIRDLRVNMQHSQPSQSLTGKTEVIYNGVKHFDIDYNVGTGAVKSIAINMAAPKSIVLTGNINMASATSEANFNYEGAQYSASFELQDNKDLVFAIAIPEHNVRVASKFEINAERFAHQAELVYNNDVSKKVSYDIEVTRSSRGRQNIYDGRVVLSNRLGSLRTTFNHKVNPGRRYVTEVNIQQLVMRSDVLLKQVNGREFSTTFTAQHPSFTKDVKLSMEGAIEPEKPRIEGKMTLEYSDQEFELTAKIADESMSGNDRKYVAEAHLSHPASALDVQFSSALTNNMESMGGNMEVSYMMAKDQQVKNTALRAQINKIREELNMELSTPAKSMSVSGRRTQDEENDALRTYTVSGNLGDRNMHAELELDQESPSIDMKLHYNPDEMLHVYGKYLDPSTLKLESYHERDAGRIQDTELSLRLSNHRILNARAFARPSIIQDLQYFLSGESEIGNYLSQVGSSVSQEALDRLESFQAAFTPLQQSASEFQEAVSTKYHALHANNDLFVRDLASIFQSYFDSCAEKWNVVRTEYEQHFSRTWTKVQSVMSGVNSVMDSMARSTSDAIQMHHDSLMQIYANHRRNVNSMVLSTVDVLRNHPSVQSLHPATLFGNACQMASDYSDWFMESTLEWRTTAANMYEEVMSLPYLNIVKERLDSTMENMNWVYDYLEVDDVAKQWIQYVAENGWQSLRDLAVQHLESQASLFSFEVVSWEPSQGLAELALTVPFDIQNLRTVPDLHIAEQLEKLNDVLTAVDSHMPTIHAPNVNLWDTFYAYKPSMNPQDWIPPFSTHATLAGNQHFMTFDKKFYEFAGDCSYLLARDFVDGKFSVVANYENGIKRSLSVVSDNTQIEIRSNFKVIVDQVNSELPLSVGSTTVRRIGNTVRVDNTHGVTVICDLPHDRCTVNMTGWYFGKTGGLFGTYNYEPSDDMTTSERTMATSIEQFTKSWSMGENCRPINHAAVSPVNDESNPRYRQCSRLFVEDDSPFRVCFRQVNTSAFMSMCMSETNEQSVCNVAAFYMDECNMAGVPVRMPKECVTCDMADGRNMIEGESITLNAATVTKSADVVFAVSHRACNQEALTRLGDLAEQIERNLNAAGIQNNLYGLVGYADAGDLAQAHSHTFNGQLMGSLAAFTNGVTQLQANEQPSEDALSAVQFAANYPFRAGVSKVVILLPCDSCRDMSTSYREMRQLLISRNVQLHTLARHNFALRTETPKTSFIFGIDGNTLFTAKDVKSNELNGDTALRRQVALPNDICSSLAESADGSFFNVGQMLDTRPTTQKRFMDVFTRLVAKKAAPSECQKCECVADANGRGTPVCRKCEAEPTRMAWTELDLPQPDLNVDQIVAEAPRPETRRPIRRGRRFRN